MCKTIIVILDENRLWMGSMISRTDDKFDTGFNLTQVFVPTGDV